MESQNQLAVSAFTKQPSTSVKQIQKLYDLSPDVICTIDSNGFFVHMNKASGKLFGYAPDELAGRSYLDFVVEKDRALTEVAVHFTRNSEGPIDFQNRFQKRDGSLVDLVWSASWDESEQLLFCLVKKACEKKLVQQKDPVVEMLERTTAGFFALDKTWRVLFTSLETEKMFSSRREDLISQCFWDCFPSTKNTSFEEQCRKAVETKKPVQFDAFFEPVQKWFTIHAYPSQTGLSLLFQDLVTPKQVDDELWKSNERFRLAAKADAIYDWDIVRNDLQWGGGLYDLFGYYPEELGMPEWANLLNPEEKEKVLQNLDSALEDTTALFWEEEYRMRKKDGSYFIIYEKGFIVRDESGRATRMVGKLQDITEKREAEAERKKFTEKIRMQNQMMVEVLEQLNDGFITVDKKGKVLYWNAAEERISGVRREDVLGKVIWEVLPFLKETDLYALFKEFLINPKPVHRQYYSSFSQKWIELHAFATHNGISLFLRDINEQKKAEDQVRKLSLVTKETVNAVWIMDLDKKITWTNEAFSNETGYSREEAIGKTPGELLSGPETNASTVKELFRCWDELRAFNGEIISYTKKKEKLYTQVSCQPVFNEKGEAEHFFTIQTNITERKRAEEELRKLSLIAEQTVNTVVLSDKNRKVVWVNKAFSEMSGYSYEEAIGKELGQVFDGPQTDAELISYTKRCFKKQEPFRIEVLNYRKNRETYWADVSCQPLFDEQGNLEYFFSIATDISERKKLEKELLLQQKKMNVAVIAAQEKERAQIGLELHDNVNQVLTTVKLYIELCRDGVGNSNEIMDKSIALLQNSISEIRSLSKRLSAPSLGSIRLQESIRELIEAVRVTGKIMILLDDSGIEDLDVTQEVHLAVYRILQEHFTNILKHANAKQVSVVVYSLFHSLILQVTDDGRGFDPAEKRSGIGLTNMQSRAESLKGSLNIISSPGTGCTLIARFPLDS